jgi:hypothetical protein
MAIEDFLLENLSGGQNANASSLYTGIGNEALGIGGGNFNTASIMPGSLGPSIPQDGGWFSQGLDWFKGTGLGEKFGSGLDWLGENKEGVSTGLGALGTLFSMYAGWKSMGLAEDKLDAWKKDAKFKRDATRQDYTNQLENRWMATNAQAEYEGVNWAGSGGKDKYVQQRALPA